MDSNGRSDVILAQPRNGVTEGSLEEVRCKPGCEASMIGFLRLNCDLEMKEMNKSKTKE